MRVALSCGSGAAAAIGAVRLQVSVADRAAVPVMASDEGETVHDVPSDSWKYSWRLARWIPPEELR